MGDAALLGVGDKDLTCTTCMKTFSSFTERLHEKQEHAEASDVAEAEKMACRTKARWAAKKGALIANFEASNLCKPFIN